MKVLRSDAIENGGQTLKSQACPLGVEVYRVRSVQRGPRWRSVRLPESPGRIAKVGAGGTAAQMLARFGQSLECKNFKASIANIGCRRRGPSCWMALTLNG